MRDSTPTAVRGLHEKWQGWCRDRCPRRAAFSRKRTAMCPAMRRTC